MAQSDSMSQQSFRSTSGLSGLKSVVYDMPLSSAWMANLHSDLLLTFSLSLLWCLGANIGQGISYFQTSKNILRITFALVAISCTASYTAMMTIVKSFRRHPATALVGIERGLEDTR